MPKGEEIRGSVPKSENVIQKFKNIGFVVTQHPHTEQMRSLLF